MHMFQARVCLVLKLISLLIQALIELRRKTEYVEIQWAGFFKVHGSFALEWSNGDSATNQNIASLYSGKIFFSNLFQFFVLRHCQLQRIEKMSTYRETELKLKKLGTPIVMQIIEAGLILLSAGLINPELMFPVSYK